MPHGASARYVAPPAQLQLPTGLRQVCRTPTRPGRMQCDALARIAVAGTPAATAPPAGALQPAQLTGAYGLASAARSLGGGETVAIVDAYDDAHAASDLAVYRSHYGLPACTTVSGCLTIVNQYGAAGPLPRRAVAWAEEETLDLDVVSAICPNCRILLVEARNPGVSNLSQAEATAAARARYVTNGWGSGSEFVGENQFDHDFDQPGVAITAAAGNFGYGTQWPAASQYVTAVGGTTLSTAGSGSSGYSRAAETAWSLASDAGAGSSGCSVLEAKPSWQQDSGCPNRTENDVAADANPDTGAAVYDSVPEHGLPQGWQQLGGTSLAAAIIAATYALANSHDSAALGAPRPGTYPSSLSLRRPGRPVRCDRRVGRQLRAGPRLPVRRRARVRRPDRYRLAGRAGGLQRPGVRRHRHHHRPGHPGLPGRELTAAAAAGARLGGVADRPLHRRRPSARAVAEQVRAAVREPPGAGQRHGHCDRVGRDRRQ